MYIHHIGFLGLSDLTSIIFAPTIPRTTLVNEPFHKLMQDSMQLQPDSTGLKFRIGTTISISTTEALT